MPPSDNSIITRPRNASPLEELQLREQGVPPRLKLADEEVAVLLMEPHWELVEDDGAIRCTLAGRKFEYYATDSPTCQNQRGKKVLVVHSRSFPEAIFVIQPNRVLLDTIPLRSTLKWFDYDAMGREIREQEQVLHRAKKELEELHGDEIRDRHYRGRGNVKKVEGWRDARHLHTMETTAKDEGGRLKDEILPAQQNKGTNTQALTRRLDDALPTVPSDEPEPRVDSARQDFDGEGVNTKTPRHQETLSARELSATLDMAFQTNSPYLPDGLTSRHELDGSTSPLEDKQRAGPPVLSPSLPAVRGRFNHEGHPDSEVGGTTLRRLAKASAVARQTMADRMADKEALTQREIRRAARAADKLAELYE